jgi:hypothetical protein
MNSSHRDLPPPNGTQLPPLPSTAMSNRLPPVTSFYGNEHSVQHWLQAKTEEDRRAQEEERTRQATMKLEQRRIEQSMLADSLQAGVPPQMIPLIFAGISGGANAQSTIDIVRQYIAQTPNPPMSPASAQIHAQLPPQPQEAPAATKAPVTSQYCPQPGRSKRSRSSTRTLPAPPYAAQKPQPAAVAAPVVDRSLPQPTVMSNSLTPPTLGGPIAPPYPADAAGTRLPPPDVSGIVPQSQPTRLSTTQPGTATFQAPAQPPAKQEGRPRRSSGISFHHWVPPTKYCNNTSPTKAQQAQTSSSNTPSHLRSEPQSPQSRKRKSQSMHTQGPPPPSCMSDTGSINIKTDGKSPPTTGSQQDQYTGPQREVSSSQESRPEPRAEAEGPVLKTEPDTLIGRDFKSEADSQTPDSSTPDQKHPSAANNGPAFSRAAGPSTRSGRIKN